jgi:uncharacterized protein (TIGR03435 family)
VTHGALAQTDGRPSFEVATIKLAATNARGTFIEFAPGGRINLTNMTLKGMIGFAWDVQAFQISGGPSWLDSIRYDVTAKPERSPKSGEFPAMVQALLADRFQLAVRHGAKELPIYALILARKDGRLGPGLTESKEGSCTPFDPSRPPQRPLPGTAPRRICGNSSVNPSRLAAIGVPIVNLVPMLQMVLGRTVVDRTGLTGNFDVSMEWAPDETQAMQWPPDVPRPPQSNAAGPSLFAAIQEQLGLKLESAKGPVEVIVIDRAERPSDN